MGAFLVLSHIGYPFISKIKMSNNKNEIKYLEVKKKKTTNIWKWEQVRKTIREKQRVRQPLNQAADCAVKGSWAAVGVCALVPVHSLSPGASVPADSSQWSSPLENCLTLQSLSCAPI